jgi:hypothetical protein
MKSDTNVISLAIRTNPANANHHLWNNHGTWYVHYTIYPTPYTAERIRQSLKTRDLHTARKRRDDLFRKIEVSGAVPMAS